ncbi:DNA repair helicase [Testicularia cyperi]|uniref:ATP-dependent DNA helicase CHL1 n=1 Tax=Testicularia cyperi TaxID=1882483 RepID=A0A317XP65_9BASI|nr:DNA repair helicase [Testicularia cyperi]
MELESLRLPTPGQSADAVTASREFNFPYPQAYDIQLDLMRNVFDTIEQGKVGLFESPTGTGKSLSLICAAFTWLRQNEDRANLGQQSDTRTANPLPEALEEPDWVQQHQIQKSRRLKKIQDQELKERIAAARSRQAQLKKAYHSGQIRSKLSSTADSESDDDLLLDDEANQGSSRKMLDRASYSNRAILEAQGDQDSDLSPALRTLMRQYEQSKALREGIEDEEEPETLPRIVYASRTHSQLSQFVAELRKTAFGQNLSVEQIEQSNDGAKAVKGSQKDQHSVRTISLGSRKQMCINEEVQRLGRRKGAEAMNERCLELMKSTSEKSRCRYLPPFDSLGKAQILEFRDTAMAEVGDIEDLVQLGRTTKTCPYFAARTSAKQAELVTLPYNLLLQKDARQSLGISLTGCVVLIDEAHNLIDTILSSHSVTITDRQIELACSQIQTYLDRFASRLKGVNEQNLRKMRALLIGARAFIRKWSQTNTVSHTTSKASSKDEVIPATEFFRSMSGGLDQINLITLEAWLKDTQIARKVSGYADRHSKKQAAAEAMGAAVTVGKQAKGRPGFAAKGTHSVSTTSQAQPLPTPSASPISAMHSIETFLLSLANRTEDGRIILERRSATGPGEMPTISIKYQLLNPSHVFRGLVDEARSVVLAGGTMEPMSDFRQQLLPFLDSDRLATFSCGHVIPPSNLMVSVLGASPKGIPFEFKYENRENVDLLDELGRTLTNLSNVIPDGLVVFVPSYAFLDTVFRRWSDPKSGLMQRIAAKKKVFAEPKTSMEVDAVLQDYAAEIERCSSGSVKLGGASNGSGNIRNGAILFAVVGAKLSEGINFSDQLARGVVMVGMPFANIQSPELAERMKYVRELSKQQAPGSACNSSKTDPGNELYTNLCMKAVNQSIGRAVRHQNDYAALILLDRRYGRPDMRARLPGWILARRSLRLASSRAQASTQTHSLSRALAQVSQARGYVHQSASVPIVIGSSCTKLRSFATTPRRRATEIKPYLLADVGEGITECEIIKWFVQPGAVVQEFDPICEVQSDKASVEITSRYAGKIKRLMHKEGDVAKVGHALCEIEMESEGAPDAQSSEISASRDPDAPSGASPKSTEAIQITGVTKDSDFQEVDMEGFTSSSTSSSSNKHDILATPAVRRVSREHNVDLAQVRGTGRDGRITKEDVLNYIQRGSSAPSSSAPSSTGSSSAPASSTSSAGGEEIIDLTPVQRAMFKHMTATLQVPHFAYSDEIDVTELEKIRVMLSKTIPASFSGTEAGEAAFSKLTLLPLLLKAMSLALHEHPMFRSILKDNKLHRRQSHDVSIALTSKVGLLTPCITNVQEKSIYGVSADIVRLQTKAASDKGLGPAELRSTGTITLSNVGAVGGGTYTHPLLPPTGQLAIGGLGRSRILPRFASEIPTLNESDPDKIVRRLIMPVSFTGDHRVVEGADLAKLVNRWKQLVENPSLWLGLMN